jgi:tetratricopeptide (TPR) repeat protein
MRLVRTILLLWIAGTAVSASAQQLCEARNPLTQVQIQLLFGDESDDRGLVAAQDTTHHSESADAQRRPFDSDTDIRVQLSEQLGGLIAEATPSHEGKVVFSVCKLNRYSLRVTGSKIQEVSIESVQPAKGDRLLTIVLHPKLSKERQKARDAAVSAARLRVPKKAQKEVEKGNRAWKDEKLDLARKHFEKAIQIYPQFDEAENDLGLVLMQQGERQGAQAAFERAVAANGKYAPALVNLAKLAFDSKQYADASRFAKQALTVEPLSPAGLFVATEAAFFLKHYSETISYAKTLHTLPHSKYALAHYLSGKALEAQGQIPEAAMEYQTFVDEDPSDPNATRARELLALLQRVLAGPSAPKEQYD